jgi:hypothetical protein
VGLLQSGTSAVRSRIFCGVGENNQLISGLFSPEFPWEWFFWRSDSAVLESSFAGQPQGWSSLIGEAESRDKSALPVDKRPMHYRRPELHWQAFGVNY